MKEHDKHSPLKPGAQKLSDIWRRFTVSAALATVLVTGAATLQPAQAQSNPKPPDPQRTEQMTDPVKPPALPQVLKRAQIPMETAQQKALREFARHVLARRVLLADARENFATLAQLARTSYSGQLDSLQTSLNQRLQGIPQPLNGSVFILDPAQFDVGSALGFTPTATIEKMLAAGNVTADKETVESVGGKMAGSYMTPYGRVLTQEPSAFFNTTSPATPQVCLLVPSSDFAVPYNIEGLTLAQNISLINAHESWHCLDSRYSYAGIDIEQVQKDLKGDMPMAESALVRQLVSVMHHKETLGDVGAVGDKIRHEGMDLTLIDRMIDWRAQQRDDLTHITIPALKLLKSRIQLAGGVEAFRAMDELSAEQIYFNVVDGTAVSPRQIQFLVFMSLGEKIGFREALDSHYANDPEYKKAVVFSQYINLNDPIKPPSHGLPASMRPLTADEQVIWKRIQGWDAATALEDTAFAGGGRITPATMITAYGKIQNGLLQVAREHPDDKAIPLLMAKLQQVFIHNLQNTDYVQANSDRGVDLISVEPLLAKFRLPGQPPLVNNPTPRVPGS